MDSDESNNNGDSDDTDDDGLSMDDELTWILYF